MTDSGLAYLQVATNEYGLMCLGSWTWLRTQSLACQTSGRCFDVGRREVLEVVVMLNNSLGWVAYPWEGRLVCSLFTCSVLCMDSVNASDDSKYVATMTI